MNPFVVDVTCSVCGQPGVAHACERGFTWTHAFYHEDPAVCAEYLREKREQLDQRERELNRGSQKTA